MPSKAILVGVAGWGSSHLTNLRRLSLSGHAEIIALVDPSLVAQCSTDPSLLPPDAPLFGTLSDALSSAGQPDVVIICTPIHLHYPLTREALLAGADVLLEKPPFARMEHFDAILALERETGRRVQVGFQSLGSAVLPALLAPGGDIAIGKILSVRAVGTWLRRNSYWNRAGWVGKRSMGDIDVMDGVATNALSHAVITALHLAGIRQSTDVGQIEAEMYRANLIDVDDTTSLRITPSTPGGPKVVVALTLCAAEQTFPSVEIVGEGGTAIFHYVSDTLSWAGTERKYDRVNLLQNLIEHRTDGTPLIVPLVDTGAFMRVLDHIQAGPPPVHIQRRYIDVRGEGDDGHRVISDIEHWVRRAAESQSLFSEIGAPWAWIGRDRILAEGRVEGKTILQVQDGGSIQPTSSPRPYIHPIRTLGGVEVSATQPADHDWHCGLGFAVPDVDGCSFWGGGTYIHGRGYVDLENHGRIISESIDYIPSPASAPPSASAQRPTPSSTSPASIGFDQTLLWTTHTGSTPLREVRSIRYAPLPALAGQAAWELTFRTTLIALSGPVSLGSPGSNGRVGGGYGGFFWRLPRCIDVTILSGPGTAVPSERREREGEGKEDESNAKEGNMGGSGGEGKGMEGEETIHGSTSSWISWSARFESKPGSTGWATLVIIPEESARGDPWVVRKEAYPGVGSAVAWDKRTVIEQGGRLERGFRVGVVDGKLDREGVEGVVRTLQGRMSSVM